VLWLLTLALPAPFGGHDASSIDAPAIVCKVSELVGLIALVALALQGGQFAAPGKSSRPKLVGEAVVVSLIVGAGFFGLGKAAEPLFPQWHHEAGHSHEEIEHEADHDEHVQDGDATHEHNDEHAAEHEHNHN
jgi:ABC-type nickel/cobalt efflux system permease component RcnA